MSVPALHLLAPRGDRTLCGMLGSQHVVVQTASDATCTTCKRLNRGVKPGTPLGTIVAPVSAPAESKHTPGEAAMRAAEELCTYKDRCCSDGCEWTRDQMAAVIDREFRNNHEELVEALKNIAGVGHARASVERANDKLDQVIEWARAALAKVSGVSK